MLLSLMLGLTISDTAMSIRNVVVQTADLVLISHLRIILKIALRHEEPVWTDIREASNIVDTHSSTVHTRPVRSRRVPIVKPLSKLILVVIPPVLRFSNQALDTAE